MEKAPINISQKFNDLKPYQQKTVELFLENFSQINSLNLCSISSEGMVCRKCGENKFVKNGITNKVQRYQCKSCKSTQFHDANTPLYNMRLKDRWPDFVFLMLDNDQNKTIKCISEKLQINPKTTQRWRHKFLASLNTVNTIELSDETEMDEVYFPFTVKGVIGKEKFDVYIAHNHPDNVESEFRIEEKKKEKEKFQSIFMCIHNRHQDFDCIPIKNQKKGIVSESDIKRIMSDIDLANRTIITDSEPSLKAFLNKIENINHLTFKSSNIKEGKLIEKKVHNNNINNTMMLLKNWMKGFYGISTKYLHNYLKWFRYIRLFEIYKMKEMLRFTLIDKASYPRDKNAFENYVVFATL